MIGIPISPADFIYPSTCTLIYVEFLELPISIIQQALLIEILTETDEVLLRGGYIVV